MSRPSKPKAPFLPNEIVQTMVEPPETIGPVLPTEVQLESVDLARDTAQITHFKAPPEAPLESNIIVRGPEKGRRRAGYSFGPELVVIPLADLTEEKLLAIQSDPELMVSVNFNPETA